MARRYRAFVLIAALTVPMVGSAADTHYGFNRNIPAGFRLGRAHEALDNAMVYIAAEQAAMAAMIDGDGTMDAHYAPIKTAYGFGTDAEARAAYTETQSVWGKLSVDSSVSSVNAAIKQWLARLRS